MTNSMLANLVLIAGSTLVLTLALGQLLIRRKISANKLLFSLFLVSSIWISHAVSFRFGMINVYPHLNKVYLPLLCVTGSLWYSYLRSLHESISSEKYDLRHLIPPAACILLSIPFYLQSSTYKQLYIETNIVDLPTATMYLATRLAELTLIGYFAASLFFLNAQKKSNRSIFNASTSRFLWALTAVALIASITRLVGSVIGDHTVSVLFPTLLSLAVFICLHLMSYRSPVLLALDRHGPRQIKALPDVSEKLRSLDQQIVQYNWHLDPNLKLQTLARKFETPANELSTLINQGSGRNFKEYINQFRIEHAKKLLIEQTDMSILDVTHASGFNSKSVFYEIQNNL